MPQVLDSAYQNQDYYEQIYQRKDDPWDYYSAAEQAKYSRMIDAAKRLQPRPCECSMRAVA